MVELSRMVGGGGEIKLAHTKNGCKAVNGNQQMAQDRIQ
jgi:hypothetical protein